MSMAPLNLTITVVFEVASVNIKEFCIKSLKTYEITRSYLQNGCFFNGSFLNYVDIKGVGRWLLKGQPYLISLFEDG